MSGVQFLRVESRACRDGIPSMLFAVLMCSGLLTFEAAGAPQPKNRMRRSRATSSRSATTGRRHSFRGHVVLTEEPYILHSDNMRRTKTTGIVDADGHINGTWHSDKGEKDKSLREKRALQSRASSDGLMGKSQAHPLGNLAGHGTRSGDGRPFYRVSSRTRILRQRTRRHDSRSQGAVQVR